jgi:hypothetical protein
MTAILKKGDFVRIKKGVYCGRLFGVNETMASVGGLKLVIKKADKIRGYDQEIWFEKPKWLDMVEFNRLINRWHWDNSMVEKVGSVRNNIKI